MQVMTTPTSGPQSLLQSRSLRDLRTPPCPEKSRRQILRPNRTPVSREDCSLIPAIKKSSFTEVVQIPQDPRRESPVSFHVSPFIIASRSNVDMGRPSRASSYETPPQSSTRPSILSTGNGVQGLRNPPVDPRKHRRLCSDFGLNRTDHGTSPLSSPVPDISSLASTPLATYEETESDTDTSINQVLESSFPQPPPIHETLHLRRMRSSPMFNTAEKELMAHSLKKRWGVAARMSNGSQVLCEHWDGTSNISSDSHYASDIEDSNVIQPTNSQVAVGRSPRPRVIEQASSLTPNALQSPDISTSSPSSGQREHRYWKRTTTTFMPRDSVSPVRPAIKLPAVHGVTPLHTELSKSMDRLESSIEKLKTHDPRHSQRKVAAPVFIEPRMIPHHPLPFNPPSLAQAGRKKPIHRSHVSTPALSAPGLSRGNPFSQTSLVPNDLGTPSNKQVKNQPLEVSHNPRPLVPKSFIDITPERVDPEVKKSSRVRSMRKLIARASIGMFNWGKSMNTTKNMS